jgi:hypothetical protein
VYGCDQIIGGMAENTFLDSTIPVLTRQTGLYTFDYTDTMLEHAGASDCHHGHKVRSAHQRTYVYITVRIHQQFFKATYSHHLAIKATYTPFHYIHYSATDTMLSSATAAAILAFSAPALAANFGWKAIEAVNTATGNSLGYVWSEPNNLQYPDPVYGDARYDFMFRMGVDNNKLVEVSDEPADAEMRCAKESPSPCTGTAYFDVGGGQWEAGNYLVQGGFRYAGTANYTIDDEFLVDNYNNDTGKATFEYVGSNDRNQPYAWYGMYLRNSIGHSPEKHANTRCSLRRYSQDRQRRAQWRSVHQVRKLPNTR